MNRIFGDPSVEARLCPYYEAVKPYLDEPPPCHRHLERTRKEKKGSVPLS